MQDKKKEHVDVEVIDSDQLDEETAARKNETEETIEAEETDDVVTPDQSEELLQIQAENEQLQDRLLRLQAEFENYKRRTNKERISERKYKSEEVITALLPVLDNFDRALQTEISEENKGFYEGVKMVYNQMIEVFENEDVNIIETENEPFDPNMHHAVMQVEDDEYESNVIVEQLQTGYTLKDKVIRPAMVKVNK